MKDRPAEPAAAWKGLFASPPADAAASASLELVVLKKGGEPLLVLPRHGRAARLALSLFPAQTARARLARSLWRQMVRWGLAAGPALRADRLRLDSGDPFVRFLNSLANGAGPPLFALLAGNPRTPGRRFLVLVFDARGRPAAVVKAGTEKLATELIEREASFLAAAPADLLGLPRVRDRFQHGQVAAFAMDFIPGDAPRPSQADGVVPLLNNWLDRRGAQRLSAVPLWQRLAEATARDQRWARLTEKLEGVWFHPALFHGDLAPWNIKVSPATGSWTVLDWERGEGQGPPAWDWFHFVLQPAILVERQSAPALARTAQRLLDSAPFRQYAQVAGIAGREREWLLAYLRHCRDVLRPAEGLARTTELLDLLERQWTGVMLT